jgi:tRNA(fMet)-specific endonuclease VapC
MFDTNICIYIQRQKPETVLEHFKKLYFGQAVISIITWGELLYGAAKSSKHDLIISKLEEFINLIPILPLTKECGSIYGSIRAYLESKGKIIGNNDLLIIEQIIFINTIIVWFEFLVFVCLALL